jgi:hypothetical protein
MSACTVFGPNVRRFQGKYGQCRNPHTHTHMEGMAREVLDMSKYKVMVAVCTRIIYLELQVRHWRLKGQVGPVCRE